MPSRRSTKPTSRADEAAWTEAGLDAASDDAGSDIDSVDLQGPAAIVMGVATVMALVAGLRWKYFAVLCALGMAAFVAAVLAEPYRLKRIVDFVHGQTARMVAMT